MSQFTNSFKNQYDLLKLENRENQLTTKTSQFLINIVANQPLKIQG